jgi:CDP-glucose 4,6-dehydratase|tara:strand:+ start:5413 stop:6498 length:1086 start_codon:yes stop_codon:yes gene_type:complete
MILNNFKNKTVIVTGHTGFKGSWLSQWLILLGAKVIGVSNNIPSVPSHFKLINLKKNIVNKQIDVVNLKELKKTFVNYKPDYVFHLAGQALVKNSFTDPVKTWKTNTIGTLNILESLKELNKKCIAVLITSDKSYKNLEIKRGYRESDILGGHDPYSASKAGAELVIQSHIKSFFPKENTNTLICVARAGNVIGGGDWSNYRLIPDCIKSWTVNKKVVLRSPNSTRPWQHVLEAIWGYLLLASKMKKEKKLHGEVFNFGPINTNNYSVLQVVKTMKKNWEKISWTIPKSKKKSFYESSLLKINSNKAKKKIKWKCILTFSETMQMVVNWYKINDTNSKIIYKTTINQIKDYEKLLKKRGIK